MTPRHNVAHPIQNVLLPGIEGPFRFDSGVTLSGPIPNPAATNRANPGSVAILDFSGPLDPRAGITVAGIGRTGDLRRRPGPLRVRVPEPGHPARHAPARIPLRRRRGPRRGVRDGDARHDHALGLRRRRRAPGDGLDPDGRWSLWAGNFLGLERAEGIRKVTFSGDHLVLDGLAFEPGFPVPEPSALVVWGAIASAAVAKFVAAEEACRGGDGSLAAILAPVRGGPDWGPEHRPFRGPP